MGILPGVNTEDLFWDTTTFGKNTGRPIWDSEETTYLSFQTDYVPENINFQTPNHDKTYNGHPNPSWNNGYNGIAKENIDCRDCWNRPEVVYLQYKDILAEYITSTKFLRDMKDANVVGAQCADLFSVTTYAYVSFSAPADEWVGTNPKRRGQNAGLQNLWVLMLLLVPVSIVLYIYYNAAGVGGTSKYDEDKAKESELANVAASEEEHQV